MPDDGSRLYGLLEPLYIELLSAAWNDAAEQGIVSGPFSLENPYVQDVLAEIATLIKDVATTTRDEVRALVGQAAREGWAPQDLAARIEELSEIRSSVRAELIGRTEAASAYERGSHAYYRVSGMVAGTEWLLGREPCDICKPLGGKVVPLGEEFTAGVRHAPAHPRCTCATAPVLEG